MLKPKSCLRVQCSKKKKLRCKINTYSSLRSESKNRYKQSRKSKRTENVAIDPNITNRFNSIIPRNNIIKSEITTSDAQFIHVYHA